VHELVRESGARLLDRVVVDLDARIRAQRAGCAHATPRGP